ncbi:hypothetical protein QFZ77_007440 [Paenibacillus sp. V4I3]|uniref:hypothetical protein n=1 Tax=unclassified Paenibacillus TaxID=185978 RepID=UPI002782C05D|nr:MULTISPECIES: hypothetical protein [unclassified Paenibacillus]MDQ0872712.1 hypothetical protein [Paenibacillus sp. V4I3]MDQ0878781.1 hypothetical protein [Paenibacillus sp. V4I3]MDQ0885367.1 hypothetical protein [Paenibacillus sp. V4I9]MDQ0891393.1 hypothetical protein [Paenibacillus sp. V4I9]
MVVQKRLIYYILLGVSALILLYFFITLISNRIDPVGSSVTEEALIHDLKIIAADKVSVERIDVISNNKSTKEAIPERDGTIDETAKVLYVISKTKDNRKLNHVYAAMEMFIYMNERQVPFKVKGIQLGTTRKYMVDQLWKITVTQEEFNELYATVDKKNLTNEQVVQLLGDQWTKKHNYKGWLK